MIWSGKFGDKLVSDALVDTVKGVTSGQQIIQHGDSTHDLQVGDSVKITEGPFSGKGGVVTGFKSTGKSDIQLVRGSRISIYNDHLEYKGESGILNEAGYDAIDKKSLKKKFKDRDDKDIDNDGDEDEADRYLHKRRKAIGKNMKKRNGNGETIEINPEINELLGIAITANQRLAKARKKASKIQAKTDLAATKMSNIRAKEKLKVAKAALKATKRGEPQTAEYTPDHGETLRETEEGNKKNIELLKKDKNARFNNPEFYRKGSSGPHSYVPKNTNPPKQSPKLVKGKWIMPPSNKKKNTSEEYDNSEIISMLRDVMKEKRGFIVGEGQEKDVSRYLEKRGFDDYDFWFSNGLQVTDKATGTQVIKALKKWNPKVYGEAKLGKASKDVKHGAGFGVTWNEEVDWDVAQYWDEETVADFIKRGGKIKKLKPRAARGSSKGKMKSKGARETGLELSRKAHSKMHRNEYTPDHGENLDEKQKLGASGKPISHMRSKSRAAIALDRWKEKREISKRIKAAAIRTGDAREYVPKKEK